MSVLGVGRSPTGPFASPTAVPVDVAGTARCVIPTAGSGYDLELAYPPGASFKVFGLEFDAIRLASAVDDRRFELPRTGAPLRWSGPVEVRLAADGHLCLHAVGYKLAPARGDEWREK